MASLLLPALPRKTLVSKLKISEPWRHAPLTRSTTNPYKYYQRAPPPSQNSSPRRQISPFLTSTYSQAPSASESHPSQMAVLSLGCGSDKENAPPPPSAARGIAVKRQTMKRPGGGSKQAPRRRPPLRDITGLFVTAPCPPPPSTAVLLALSDAGAGALPEAVRVRAGVGGASDGVTVKQGSHLLRMGFR